MWYTRSLCGPGCTRAGRTSSPGVFFPSVSRMPQSEGGQGVGEVEQRGRLHRLQHGRRDVADHVARILHWYRGDHPLQAGDLCRWRSAHHRRTTVEDVCWQVEVASHSPCFGKHSVPNQGPGACTDAIAAPFAPRCIPCYIPLHLTRIARNSRQHCTKT